MGDTVGVLQGLVLESVGFFRDGAPCPSGKGATEILFRTRCGRTFKMYHEQECCESVELDDVVGDPAHLLGEPVLRAYESSNEDTAGSVAARFDQSATWTFYVFATVRGWVTLRWLGSSNGYYSESVSFTEVK